MRTTRSHWIFTAVLFMLLVVPLEAGQKLHYKFEQGKNYSYATTIENKITGQGMDRSSQ